MKKTTDIPSAGGKAVLKKYGREHFRRLAAKRWSRAKKAGRARH